MRMNDVLKNKGIEIDEKREYNFITHPANNGKPHFGRIRKEIMLPATEGWDKKNPNTQL